MSDLAEGYELEGWYLNGSKQTDVTGTTFTYSVQVGVGAEIQAKIIRSSYAVTFYGDNGTVTAMADDGQIRSGDLVVGDAQVTFTARPESDSGYTFAGWIVNGESRSEETEALTLTITEATEVQAVYTLNAVKYTVSYGVLDGNGTVTVDPVLSDSPALVNAGTGLTFTAQPETGFQVAGWYSDAAGSTVIPGTAAEQNSYTIGNLTDDAAVYVKFEPVPTYTISVAVSGRGSVTATVNGVEASVVQGTLTVSRHDDVVLIAHPEADQYLSGWTLDGAEQVNNLTLTLEDVTGAHQVTACFEASQLVNFTTVCGTGGTLSAQAGYGDELDDIVADKGTQLEKGKKVVLTVVPDDGMMISRWMVNDEVQDTLSNTLNIESLTENTTVEVTFEPLTLFDLPADGLIIPFPISVGFQTITALTVRSARAVT